MHLFLRVCLACLTVGLFLTGPACDQIRNWSNPIETVDTLDEVGNRLVIQRRTSDGVLEGSFVRYDEEGNVFETANYVDGKMDGLQVFFFPEGDTLSVRTVVQDELHGPYFEFYRSGQVELEGQYDHQVMTGIWRKYYEDGALMEEVQMADNAENGPFVEYYPDGTLKAEGEYKDGPYEHGLLKLYNEQGELVKKMECNMGMCKTIWDHNEQ